MTKRPLNHVLFVYKQSPFQSVEFTVEDAIMWCGKNYTAQQIREIQKELDEELVNKKPYSDRN